jgi:uncharacterized protein
VNAWGWYPVGEPSRGHVLIAGVSTRALAVSAAKAGYAVTAVDGFGDQDLRLAAEVVVEPTRPGKTFNALEAAIRAEKIPADLAAYTSNFENYPAAVARLSRGRKLLGNPPPVLRRVRNPLELSRALRRHRVLCPGTRASAPDQNPHHRWLLKPRRSGGGHGVRSWRPGTQVPRGMYLQQYIRGTPGSIILAANGRTAVILGLSRQLTGITELGARGFQYCGSLLAGDEATLFLRQAELLHQATALATIITREFGLIGVNGIDFIARGGVLYPIEVNPRFSASMELVERATGLSMFGIHAAACDRRLPRPKPAGRLIHGKAIVFARRSITIRDSNLGNERESLADLPHPGEHIERGRPICTVLAQAATLNGCRDELFRRAARVYRSVSAPIRRAS